MINSTTALFFNSLVYFNAKKRVVFTMAMFVLLVALVVAPQMVVFAGGSTSTVCPGGC